jgi:hypothetical protein
MLFKFKNMSTPTPTLVVSAGFAFDHILLSEHPQMLASILAVIIPGFSLVASNVYPQGAVVRYGEINFDISKPSAGKSTDQIRLTLLGGLLVTPELIRDIFANALDLNPFSLRFGHFKPEQPLSLEISCQEGQDECVVGNFVFANEGII